MSDPCFGVAGKCRQPLILFLKILIFGSVAYILCIYIQGGHLRMTVKLQKWGNSQGIRIPKFMLDDLTWSEDEMVDITVDDGKIIIERSRPVQRKNIHALFEGFKGKYEPSEVDWGDPSGREAW